MELLYFATLMISTKPKLDHCHMRHAAKYIVVSVNYGFFHYYQIIIKIIFIFLRCFHEKLGKTVLPLLMHNSYCRVSTERHNRSICYISISLLVLLGMHREQDDHLTYCSLTNYTRKFHHLFQETLRHQ